MVLHLLSWPAYAAEKPAGGDSSIQVIEAFNKADAERGKHEISDKRKQQIMFLMGITLLIFIITTVSLGVAMVAVAVFRGVVEVTREAYGETEHQDDRYAPELTPEAEGDLKVAAAGGGRNQLWF